MDSPWAKRVAQAAYGARNLLIDLRFGAPLRGVKPSAVPGQAGVVNSDYSLYPHVFPRSLVRPDDVIVDVGVGKGRFVNWLLMLGLDNRIIGIEYDRDTSAATAHRLRRWRNVTIVHADATSYLPDDGTLFFLFNPFEGEVMARFKSRVEAQFDGRRDVRLVYLRPLELQMFRNDPGWWVEDRWIPREVLDARYRDEPSYRQFAILRPCACPQRLADASR